MVNDWSNNMGYDKITWEVIGYEYDHIRFKIRLN